MPDYRALIAVDVKEFTRLPELMHGAVGHTVTQLVDKSLEISGLHDLVEAKEFFASTGDGLVFGFPPPQLPFIIYPFLDVLEAELQSYNRQSSGRLRMRVSIHVGPVSGAGADGDGSGRARNETHRLLDSEALRSALASADEKATQLVAIISQRAYEDAVLGGYTGLPPKRCVEVEAIVKGKDFAQPAWIYIPAPSGCLFASGNPSSCGDGDLVSVDATTDAGGSDVNRVFQRVKDGVANVGDVNGGIHFTPRETVKHPRLATSIEGNATREH